MLRTENPMVAAEPLRYTATTPVSAVMSAPPVCVSVDETLEAARSLMEQRCIHHLMVVDGPRFVGVLSDRDILRHLSPRLGTLAERRDDTATLRRRVVRAASFHPRLVGPDSLLPEAVALLLRYDISCLAVVALDGRVVGMLTYRDILRTIMDELSLPAVQRPAVPS